MGPSPRQPTRIAIADLTDIETRQVAAALGARVDVAELDDDDVTVILSGGTPEELARLGERYPQRARVWVCDPEDGLEGLGRGQLAHALLTRPLKYDQIAATITQAREAHELLTDIELSRLIASLGSLPSLPSTYQALCRVLVRESASMGDVAHVLERDMAVSSRVLSVVNSALYALPRTVGSVQQATSMLGLRSIRDLVLAVEVFGELAKGPNLPGVSLEDLQNRAHARGTLARYLAPKAMADRAYTTGLLLELGRMVLAAKAPDRYIAACYLLQADLSLDEAEQEVFGVTQRELGARMLALWGLPWDVVHAVRAPGPWHDPEERTVGDLVDLADRFVEEATHERIHGEPLLLVTREMLTPWGLVPRADTARHLARTLALGLVEPPPAADLRKAS